MLKRAIDDLDCSLHPNWACEQDRRRMAERSTTRSQMPLFDVAGNGLDQGYMNLRDGDSAEERHIVATLERMWQRFEPFADLDFRQGFARDPDGRFWEMYLACALLDTDKVLLARADYPQGGVPDICVVEGDRRIWIEAIAPTAGGGADQVPELVALNQGGEVIDQPLRQVHLRITSALLTKAGVLAGYRDRGIIRNGDVGLVAIGGGRFALQAAGEVVPHAVSAVYPIGNEFVRVNRHNMQIVGHGFYLEEDIQRAGGDNIPRTAFLDARFAHVSGLIWSRASIGNMHRCQRPLTLIHNHAAATAMPRNWDAWDKEYLTDVNADGIKLSNIAVP